LRKTKQAANFMLTAWILRGPAWAWTKDLQIMRMTPLIYIQLCFTIIKQNILY